MRMLLLAVLFPLAASAVSVAPLPQSAYADTEVSTNIPFAVTRATMTRIKFSVALETTPSNNVEVAIGTDANADGNLAPEEAAYVFGYDCGEWFCRDAARGLEGLGGEGAEKTFILKKRKLDEAWNLVKVTRRGFGVACELVKAEGRKPGFKLELR